MNLEIEQKIDEGKAILNNGLFPGDVIESVSDKGLRKYVYDEIFIHPIPFEYLKETEQKKRSALLNVQFSFLDYLFARERFKPASVVLFMFGFITFVTAYIKMNHNLNQGVITMLEGVILFVLTFEHKRIAPYLSYIVLALALVIGLEIAILGWVDTYFSFMYRSPFFEAAMNRRPAGGTMMVMFNESTPIIYMVVKLMPLFYIFRLFLKRQKYLRIRFDFEQGK